MFDTLHLIRLLRHALTLLRESTDPRDRDRVICQLIADLQASLVHSAPETPNAPAIEPRIGDPRPWLVMKPIPA
jgi:hypothetical protein